MALQKVYRVWTWLYSPAFLHPSPPPLLFLHLLSSPLPFSSSLPSTPFSPSLLLLPSPISPLPLPFPLSPLLFIECLSDLHFQHCWLRWCSNLCCRYPSMHIQLCGVWTKKQHHTVSAVYFPRKASILLQVRETVNFVFHFHLTLSAAPRPKITVLYTLINLVKLWWIMQQSSCMLQKCYNIPFWLACRQATANKVWCQNKPMHRDVVIC